MNLIALISMIASLAGSPAGVTWTCDPTLTQYFGLSYPAPWYTPPRVRLSSVVCDYLGQQDSNPTRFGVGVHVIVHESGHQRGDLNEYRVETRAEELTNPILVQLYSGELLAPSPLNSSLYAASDVERVNLELGEAEQGSDQYHFSLPPQYLTP